MAATPRPLNGDGGPAEIDGTDGDDDDEDDDDDDDDDDDNDEDDDDDDDVVSLLISIQHGIAIASQ